MLRPSSGLLSKLLLASPDARITIADIQKDRWFTQGKSQYQYNRISSKFKFYCSLDWFLSVVLWRCKATTLTGVRRKQTSSIRCGTQIPDQQVRALCPSHCSSKIYYYFVPVILTPRSPLHSDDRMQVSSSQPDFAAGGWEAMLLISQTDGQVSFSQPTKPEHMLLGSQLLGTPGASQVLHMLTTTLISMLIYYTINNMHSGNSQFLILSFYRVVFLWSLFKWVKIYMKQINILWTP